MKSQGTAVGTLLPHVPVIVIRPTSAVVKYQTDSTAAPLAQGVAVDSATQRTGEVLVREEVSTTGGISDLRVIF